MRYLSPAWFAAAQAAIESDERLRELSAGLELTMEQIVTEGPDGPVAEQSNGTGASRPSSHVHEEAASDRTVRWHVILDHGSARLVIGPAPHPDLRFRASYDVARAIAQGELAAPIAFVRGDLTVGGDLNLLTTHQRTLAALSDVLREVRRATSFA